MPRPLAAVILPLLLIVLPPFAGAQQIERSADGFRVTTDTSFAVDPGGTIDLDATNGSLTVSSWDRDEVALTETIRFSDASRSEVQTYLADKPTRYEVANGTVRVRGPELNQGGWWSDDPDVQYRYEVQVPRRFSAQLRTNGGSIDVTGLEGTVDGKTAGGSVSAEEIVGEVRLQTAGGSVTLRAIEGPADGETSGGSVEATDVSGVLSIETAGGSIRVENAGSDVSAETAGGSIQIDTVEGSLTAQTSGGDITVRGASKTVEVETSGGDIELQNIGGRVQAETSGGDIVGQTLRGAVEASTSAGDVELQRVAGPITAETSVGDVEVEATATDYTEDPALRLTTSHGDIVLTLPASLSASIRAEVHGIPGGQADIRSDVPLTREGGDGDPLRATGTMNGGGPTIRLKTTGGDIRIRTSDS